MKDRTNDIEDYFCRQFIRRAYQERLYFELSSNNKRVKAISRFCNNLMDVINTDRVVEHCDSTDVTYLTDRLQERSSHKKGYCIGFFNLDQKWADISDAISTGICSGLGFAVVLPDGIAYMCEEAEFKMKRKSVILHSTASFEE